MRQKIPDYPDYEANDAGEIIGLSRDVRRGNHLIHVSSRILKPSRSFGGYYSVALTNIDGLKTFNIHKLIMLTFVGPANGLCINHKNSNKLDNRLVNLEYITNAENLAHASAAGRMKGSQFTYTPETATLARRMLVAGFSEKRVMRELKLGYNAMKRIINEKTSLPVKLKLDFVRD